MATNADIRFINPHLYGLDGAFECCTSTLAYYLIREKNRDIKRLIIALSGIIGDKQHLGVRGPNVEIFERADRELRWEKRSILSGRDLRDALLSSIEPFIEGISGSEEGVERFLEDLHLDGGKRVEELSLKEQEKLNSALVMVMLRARARPEVVKRIVAKRYRCDLGGLEFVDELSRMLNGCGKEGKGGLALSSLFCEDLIAEAIKIAKGRESRVLRELNHLELKDFGRLRCFWSDHSSDIATVIANYLSSDKPVFGLSKRGVIVKISARAPKELVAIGLNLSPIMEATKKLEGNGGGHSVAAGGWVPLGREEDFLRLADELVGDQIG
jgi:RecJ-like exonuclease